MNYEDKYEGAAARLWCLPQHGKKEMDVDFALSIAAFGRECAAQAYEDAMKIAERTANEYLDWSPVAWNACDDVRIDLRIKLDALRQGDESK